MLRVLLLPGLVWAVPALADPVWHNDAETCRTVTDAVLHGRVNAASDALMPDGASDTLRRDIRALMQRLSDSAAAVTEGLPPHLERVLPDLALNVIPVTVELYTFGDQKAFLVGCGIRPVGGLARISIQAYPTRDDLLDHLRQELLDETPPPGADMDPPPAP
jgi:hypothetical protein